MSFIELRQIDDNDWKGKYQGNYGVYTIKVTLEGKEAVKYSCSCPSGGYPCKHISYIEEAIEKQMATNERQNKNKGLRLEDLFKTVSVEKLREFIITQAKYNEELLNAILLEFAANVESTEDNKYSSIIQKALATVKVGMDDDDYDEGPQNIDVFDQWFKKAKDYIRQKQYDEAILICKACIEEYSRWLENIEEENSYFSDEYQSIPFDIMGKAVEHLDKASKEKLFNFCFTELKKEEYEETGFYHGFLGLFEDLALTVDPDAFIALQDELLADEEDKTSRNAETILRRKIEFYRRLHQPEKAWALLEENMQIVSFRKEVVENCIEKGKFTEAKKIINDFFTEREEKNNPYTGTAWYKLLLEIAEKEKDIPAIRELSYRFIRERFNGKYYEIYRDTFNSNEWAIEMEKLLFEYDHEKSFRSSVADLLAAEEEKERLLHYIEKHFSIDRLEAYYKIFVSEFPERTLELFRQPLISYAENNIGRSHYLYVASLLSKMSKIEGGKKMVSELVAGFRIQYKNRKAMMEILGQF